MVARTLAGLSGWVYSLSDCCPILSGLVVFVKNYFKISSLFSLFLVGIEPGAVALGVFLSFFFLAGAGAGLWVAAVLLRFFQGEPLAKARAVAVVVLVKPHDAIGAHIVSLF